MENASKALIIAGAILVSILIIGLGMTLYNNAAGTLERANIDETAVRQYNAGFTEYEGQRNVKGANIKALCRDVLTHNRSNAQDSSLWINVRLVDAEGDGANTNTAGDDASVEAVTEFNQLITTNVINHITNGGVYGVNCGYNPSTGYVVDIVIWRTNNN